jgi:hypothetical protein
LKGSQAEIQESNRNNLSGWEGRFTPAWLKGSQAEIQESNRNNL